MRARFYGLVLLGFTGCLSPGGQGLSSRDQEAPRVAQTEPGPGSRLPREGALQITFSEPMDERSLAPGIALLFGNQEVPLEFFVPATRIPEPVLRGPFTVTARPRDGKLQGDAPYTLVLRTLLTDTAGNPFSEEVRVSFFTLP